MKYRICPVCDQKMKTAHYCSNCRAWVKNPWVREVDYYLNERHPSQEGDCSYHGTSGRKSGPAGQPYRAGAGQSRNGTAGQNRTGTSGQSQSVYSGQGRMPAGNPGGGTASGQSWSSTTAQNRNSMAVPNQPRTAGQNTGGGVSAYGGATGSTPGTSGARYAAAAGKGGTYTHVAGGRYGTPQVPRATSDPRRLIIIAAVIFFAINIVFSIVHTLYKLDHPDNKKTPETYEYDMDLGGYDASGDEYWYEDMSDEEARAEGISCNGMDHFQITGEEMEEVLRGVMAEYDYDFTGIERWTENVRSNDGITWYESTTVINIQTDHETAEPYIEINSDTVTGQLHWLDIDLENREHMILFLRAVLGAMEQEQQLDPEGDILALFEADMVPLIEKTESFDYILGNVEIYGTRYDDVYSVSIWLSPWYDQE